MEFIVLLISIWIFIRTLSYAIYEIKQNSNTIGGITTIVVAVLALLLPNIVLLVNGTF